MNNYKSFTMIELGVFFFVRIHDVPLRQKYSPYCRSLGYFFLPARNIFLSEVIFMNG